jgi:hypothetical protein
MDTAEPILAEPQKISAWACMQRKMIRWSLIFVAIFIPSLIVFGVLMNRQESTKVESVVSEEVPDWHDVDQNIRRWDFDKAIQVGEKLIVKTLLYPDAHRRLAGAYFAAGSIEKARPHYAEAFRLFPAEGERKVMGRDRQAKKDRESPTRRCSEREPVDFRWHLPGNAEPQLGSVCPA